MSPVAIRPAEASDTGAILELWRVAATVVTRTDDEASIRALVGHDPKALLLAEDEDELVGSLIATFDGWRGMLFRLTVLPERRRSGIGQALVSAGERSLRERGAVRVSLYAVRAEQGARDFWLAAGYSADDYTQRFVKNL